MSPSCPNSPSSSGSSSGLSSTNSKAWVKHHCWASCLLTPEWMKDSNALDTHWQLCEPFLRHAEPHNWPFSQTLSHTSMSTSGERSFTTGIHGLSFSKPAFCKQHVNSWSRSATMTHRSHNIPKNVQVPLSCQNTRWKPAWTARSLTSFERCSARRTGWHLQCNTCCWWSTDTRLPAPLSWWVLLNPSNWGSLSFNTRE